MNTSFKYTGVVTFFSFRKRFGFIGTKSRESFFFFIDPKPLQHTKSQYRKTVKYLYLQGDEVYFKLKPSRKPEIQFDACDVEFIRNEKLNHFITFASRQTILSGMAVELHKEFFVKDKTSGLLIPFDIPEFLTEVKEYCMSRVGKEIHYRLNMDPTPLGNLQASVYQKVGDRFVELGGRKICFAQ